MSKGECAQTGESLTVLVNDIYSTGRFLVALGQMTQYIFALRTFQKSDSSALI